MTPQQKWGVRLASLRIKRGLTQDEFSVKANIDRSTVSKIENGKWKFNVEFVEIYLTVLGFNVEFNDVMP
jgi:transcriptional regulator with XRE-family HTH domain